MEITIIAVAEEEGVRVKILLFKFLHLLPGFSGEIITCIAKKNVV